MRLLPSAKRIAALINPTSTIAAALIEEARASASVIGWQIEVIYASSNRDIDAAFANFVQNGIDSAYVSPDVFFTSRRVQFATLASHYGTPVLYGYRAFTEVGELMSYGPSLSDQYRQLGVYTGRILKAENTSLSSRNNTTFSMRYRFAA